MVTIRAIFTKLENRYKDLSEEEILSFNRYFSLSHSVKEIEEKEWYGKEKHVEITIYLKICEN